MRKVFGTDEVHRLSHLFLFLNFTLALVGERFSEILHIPILRFVIYLLFLLGGVLGFISCVRVKPCLAWSVFAFILSVFLHAAVQFYLPSFRSGIAFQNYTLQELITSSFALSQTRLYMMYVALFIFPVFSLYITGLSPFHKDKYLKSFLIILSCGVIINEIIMVLQGLFDFNFLGEGSGTSVSSRRAPGLFLDSGESGVVCALAVSLPLFFTLKKNYLNEKQKITIAVISLYAVFAGVFVNSRIFYITLSLIILAFICVYFKKLFETKFIKINFNIVLPMFLVLGVIGIPLYFSRHGGFFSYYDKIDIVRSNHLKVMLAAIKEHFFTGTGLGSFHVNLSYYYTQFFTKKELTFDLPTNLYLGLTSELGVVGLSLLVFCFSLFVRKAVIFFTQTPVDTPENTKLAFVSTYGLPTVLLFPLLVCFFVGYNFCYPAIAVLVLFLLSSRDKNFYTWTTAFCVASSCYLLGVSVYFLAHIPRVPAFRWNENHLPQLANGTETLSQPLGHTEQHGLYMSEILHSLFNTSSGVPDGAVGPGRWLKFNNEMLLFKSQNKIFVPHPTSKEELVTVTYLNAHNKAVTRSEFRINQPMWIEINTQQEDKFKECFTNINAQHFCSYHLKISPNNLSNKVFYIQDSDAVYK